MELLTRDFTAGIGEQRSVALEDGSKVVLDAQTRLHVQLSKGERTFYLEGQALFTVARDPSRPFRVRTASTIIEALGTEFNVRSQGDTTVAVLDGSVRLYTPGSSKSVTNGHGVSVIAAALQAGQQIRVGSGGKITTPSHFDRSVVVAWERQRLVFSRAPLSEIVSEFNKYNRNLQLRVEGNAAFLRFGGVFDATDPSPLLLLLRKDPLVVIEQHNVNEIVIRDK